MTANKQIDFWKGEFGQEYTLRNSRSQQEWDQFHLDTWGITKIDMYQKFIGDLPKDARILEVGSNTGMQLAGLRRMGFTQLYGIEIQPDAVELSKQYTHHTNIIVGSGLDIPFKDNYFDLVFTSGVLIHISPDNLPIVMKEMVRCSRRYILGFEYYAAYVQSINYRGNEGFLWKADYAGLFRKTEPTLKEVKKEYYKYVKDDNVDAMYLLEK
ncbi:methyltransferase domain-containing protein [Rhodocytophaga rosea]|uniref:Methyltransferase domain-containing protein n=1 Tax=Rhodocytophaga rosea TaxID=2704465 RepID=A0A6C0GLJ9_9BACT|nr:pseudaminic acid biosynthesis-associated methylase [Rhodocytophaga rosea]QHT68817.1 methyltransferase domain-containing protein [Rhodocytophaga rosea]